MPLLCSTGTEQALDPQPLDPLRCHLSSKYFCCKLWLPMQPVGIQTYMEASAPQDAKFCQSLMHDHMVHVHHMTSTNPGFSGVHVPLRTQNRNSGKCTVYMRVTFVA
jgi:hypothetical protein